MFVFVVSHCEVTSVITAQCTYIKTLTLFFRNILYVIFVIMSLAYELRDQTKIYLIGDDSNQIIGSKLPSNMQVLKVLFYNLRKVKLQVRQSCS